MLEAVLDEMMLVVEVAFKADNDTILGFSRVRETGENEGSREMGDPEGTLEIKEDGCKRETIDDDGR